VEVLSYAMAQSERQQHPAHIAPSGVQRGESYILIAIVIVIIDLVISILSLITLRATGFTSGC